MGKLAGLRAPSTKIGRVRVQHVLAFLRAQMSGVPILAAHATRGGCYDLFRCTALSENLCKLKRKECLFGVFFFNYYNLNVFPIKAYNKHANMENNNEYMCIKFN
jgi:hypothetical protein